jgi:cytochrome c556
MFHRIPRLARRLALVLPAVLIVALTAPLALQPSMNHAQEPNKVSEFMRAKLVHSQKVLEGLATENFDQIAKNAQDLSLLSQAATWQVLQTAEYRDRSTEFRRSADALAEAAKKKNLEGAALAYVDVTMKCVNCHKYVRQVRMARAPAPLAEQLAPRVAALPARAGR